MCDKKGTEKSIETFGLDGEARILVKNFGYKRISDFANKKIDLWDGVNYVSGVCVSLGLKQKVIVNFYNGKNVVCCPNNKFLTINTNGNEIWKMPGEFVKNKFNKEKIRTLSESPDFIGNIEIKKQNVKTHWKAPNGVANTKIVSFRSIKNKYNLGVILGRLASDGTISKKDKNVGWIIAKHEYNICNFMKRNISLISKIREFVCKREGRQDLLWYYIDSCLLAREAKELNLRYRIPETCFSDKKLLRGMLQGLFDGDGGISGTTVTLVYGEGIKFIDYAKDVQLALELFGVKSRVRSYHDRCVVQVSTKDNHLFANRISFLNKNKQNKLVHLKKSKVTCKLQGRVDSVKSVIITNEKVEMFNVFNVKTGKFMASGLTNKSG